MSKSILLSMFLVTCGIAVLPVFGFLVGVSIGGVRYIKEQWQTLACWFLGTYLVGVANAYWFPVTLWPRGQWYVAIGLIVIGIALGWIFMERAKQYIG
jgi:hypothetical protein